MSRMNKKAQVTIAIILAVILILAVSIILYLKPSEIEGAERALIEVPEQARPVAVYVQDCVESVAIPGIFMVASQGGYMSPPQGSLETAYATVGYGYDQGKDILPSITDIELAIATYMDIAVIISKATVTWNNIIIEVEMPVTVKKADFETRIDRFSTEVPVRFGYVYNVSKEIIAQEMKDPDFIDMTYLSDLAKKSGKILDVSVIPVDDTNLLYSIADNTSSYKGGPFIFLFANRFAAKQGLILDIPSRFELRDGTVFAYDVNVTDPQGGKEGIEITYSDDTSLFDISPQGLINFTPEIPGTYEVLVSVKDKSENEASRLVTFEVR
jgi:hypothetical protein